MFKSLAQDFIMKQASKQISNKLWIDENIINKVTDEGLDGLILWLAKNTKNSEWAKWFFDAVQKDHDGSILDNIDSLFGDDKQAEWSKILDHILGNKKETIETQIWKDTGLDVWQIASILKIVAPLVLGMIGKKTKSEWLWLDDLVWLISNEWKEVANTSTGWSLLTKMLDQDGDGDFDVMDAIKMVT